MTDLAAILERATASDRTERGTAGLAVVHGPGDRVEVRWVPGDSPVEPSFLAYSITKSFTAVLMLMLQERGKLTLDDPLARWFPKVPAAARITLRHLLNHTSGVPDYGGLACYHEELSTSPGQPWTFERFAAETFEKGLLFQPGGGWAYSNPGYMLLKSIAETAGGDRYATLVRDWIARPHDLDGTFVAESLADMAALARAPSRHLSSDGRPRDTRTHYHPGWVSHGVVASRPSDIARFYHALMGGRMVARASLREMTQSISLDDDPDARWGTANYGLGLAGDPSVSWGHGGGGPGYQAFAACTPPDAPNVLSVCAMCASEEKDSLAERLALAAWQDFTAVRSSSSVTGDGHG
jgi:D-alanyl-D-alanine carboxypeptidase